MVASEGVLRKFPRGSPLANGQILIDGHVLIRLMANSMTNRRVQVIDGDVQISVLETSQHKKGLKKIMKELQVWLKVELREVRRDKRRQGDAENVQACSSIKRCKGMVMDLDQTGGVL
ncbi:hypothetical protein F2Q70_00001245 [Brassica cretica]|uniref:Uncharacterized protein n=1 Tax=Brassica cretica TaxID=69181 RepID=A0A8S9J203_BRACR|nr:hypothetical protein F2Q70_00001245 [Brassica cretica]